MEWCGLILCSLVFWWGNSYGINLLECELREACSLPSFVGMQGALDPREAVSSTGRFPREQGVPRACRKFAGSAELAKGLSILDFDMSSLFHVFCGVCGRYFVHVCL